MKMKISVITINIISFVNILPMIQAWPWSRARCGTSRNPCDLNAPPSGYCQTFGGAHFNSCGGETGVHSFICCNNINQKCNGETYQMASEGQYCGVGGETVDGPNFYAACRKRKWWRNGRKFNPFACGGCDGQEYAKKKCLKKWKYLNFPGGCWTFSDCMENLCRKLHKRRRLSPIDAFNNSNITSFCGDTVCDADESSQSCPIDCCGNVSTKCKIKRNNGSTCLPDCCSNSACCNNTNSGSSSNGNDDNDKEPYPFETELLWWSVVMVLLLVESWIGARFYVEIWCNLAERLCGSLHDWQQTYRGTWNQNSNLVTLNNVENIQTTWPVTGQGIPAGAIVRHIDRNNNTITISATLAEVGANVQLTFPHNNYELAIAKKKYFEREWKKNICGDCFSFYCRSGYSIIILYACCLYITIDMAIQTKRRGHECYSIIGYCSTISCASANIIWHGYVFMFVALSLNCLLALRALNTWKLKRKLLFQTCKDPNVNYCKPYCCDRWSEVIGAVFYCTGCVLTVFTGVYPTIATNDDPGSRKGEFHWWHIFGIKRGASFILVGWVLLRISRCVYSCENKAPRCRVIARGFFDFTTFVVMIIILVIFDRTHGDAGDQLPKYYFCINYDEEETCLASNSIYVKNDKTKFVSDWQCTWKNQSIQERVKGYHACINEQCSDAARVYAKTIVYEFLVLSMLVVLIARHSIDQNKREFAVARARLKKLLMRHEDNNAFGITNDTTWSDLINDSDVSQLSVNDVLVKMEEFEAARRQQ